MTLPAYFYALITILSTFIEVKTHNMANNMDVLLSVKYKATWCYALSKTTKRLLCIENRVNSKQASVCESCKSNNNDITIIPPTNYPT